MVSTSTKEFTVMLNTPHRIKVKTDVGLVSQKITLQVDGREIMSKDVQPHSIALTDKYHFTLDGKECYLRLSYAGAMCLTQLYIDGKPQF